MSDERVAALRYFLDLDNPYLGVDQQRIMEGIAALKSLESQNQALQERVEELAKAHACCWHGWDSSASRSLHDPEGACKPLSPTQETDPE